MCIKNFCHINELEGHKTTVQEVSIYQCEVCNKISEHGSELNEHRMKQPKEDQYDDEMNQEHKKDVAEETKEQNDDNNVHITHVASSEYKF